MFNAIYKVKFGFLILILLGLGGWWGVKSDYFLRPKLIPTALTDHQKVILTSKASPPLTVEAVTTPESIVQGLSGRDELGADGMLFVFTQPRRPSFWMKEMKFGLDLVWIREMKVVEITEHVPAPTKETDLNQLPLYTPRQPVEMVLEVEAGQASQWKIQVGDQLNFIKLKS